MLYLSGSACGVDGEAGGPGEDINTADVLQPPGVLGGQGLHHALDVRGELGVLSDSGAHGDHGAGAGVGHGQLGGVQTPGHLLGEVLGLEVYLERKLLPGVERFAEELGQQSDDPVVSQKEVKLVAKLDLGLELFVLDLELPE